MAHSYPRLILALLLLVTQIAWAGAIDWSADLCGMQKAFYDAQYSNRVTYGGVAADIRASKARVVLVGESHNEGDGPFYADFLTALKTAIPKFDCVTFEIDRRFYPTGFVRPRWNQLAGRAEQLKVRTFKIDRCIPTQDSSGNPWCPDGRNVGMHNKIATLLKTGICTKILHVGGYDHLQSLRKNAPANLAERLTARKIKNYRVAVVDTTVTEGTKVSGQSAWVWGRPENHQLVCSQQRPPTPNNFAFLNRGVELAKRIPMLYWSGPSFVGRPWSDYDAALVLGCENEPSRCVTAGVSGGEPE